MTKTYLKIFVKNRGKIFTKTNVKNFFREGDFWKVVVEQDNLLKTIKCRNLFLCCGAMHTNSLLLKSPVSKGKKHLIRKFYFHPMIKLLAKYPKEFQEMNSDISPLQIVEFYPDFIIGNAASSLQFQLLPFHNKTFLKNLIEKNFSNTAIFHTTFSIGYGKIYKIPFIKDDISFYFLSKTEKLKIQNGFKAMLSFIESTNANYIIPLTKSVKKPIYFKDSTPKQDIFSIKHSLSSVHIMGGVTSGEKKDCVVNSYGQFNGQKNLFVNDSSLINSKLLKNPQGTVLTIALRNIDHFLKNYGQISK